jgi:hypothetical protein
VQNFATLSLQKFFKNKMFCRGGRPEPGWADKLAPHPGPVGGPGAEKPAPPIGPKGGLQIVVSPTAAGSLESCHGKGLYVTTVYTYMLNIRYIYCT